EISMYNDPMIAKLIGYGDTRAAAIDRLADALDAFYVRGISHNLGFLNALVTSDRFRAGDLTTGFIAEEYPDGFDPTRLVPEFREVLVPVAAVIRQRQAEREATISGQQPHQGRPSSRHWAVLLGDEVHQVEVRHADGRHDVLAQGRHFAVRGDWEPGQPVFAGSVDGRDVHVQVDRNGAGYVLGHRGAAAHVRVLTPRAAELAALMP